MALNLITKYPGQVVAGDLFYPWGRPRNQAVDGDNTGTPLEEAWLQDLMGFLQSLLLESLQTPSGNADKLGASQYLDAVKYLTRHIVGTLIVNGGGDFTGDIFADFFAATSNGSILGNGDGSGRNVFTGTKFTGAVEATQQVTVNPRGILVQTAGTSIGWGFAGITINDAGGGLVVNAGASVFNDVVTFNDPVTVNEEIILAGAGRVRERIVYGTDSNSTYSILTADFVIARSGIVTAPRDYTVAAAGALGNKLEFRNYSASVITVKNAGGSTLGTVPVVNGGLPGILRLQFSNDGASVDRWIPYEKITP